MDRLIEQDIQKAIRLVETLDQRLIDFISHDSFSMKDLASLYYNMETAGLNPKNQDDYLFLKRAVEERRRLYQPVIEAEMANYKDLEWGLKAPRGANEKKLFYYDKSLERIRKEGGSNARHPYPNEVFSLICGGLENKLSGNLKEVYDDILNSYGEWFSMAFERRKYDLIAYLDPENLKWNRSQYIIEGKKLKYSDEKKFNIKGIKSGIWINLNKFEDDFVKFMYGRSFDDLPEEMQTGDKRVHVYLPSEGQIWPVGRDVFYGFSIDGVFDGRAARWVRKNFSIGNEGLKK